MTHCILVRLRHWMPRIKTGNKRRAVEKKAENSPKVLQNSCLWTKMCFSVELKHTNTCTNTQMQKRAFKNAHVYHIKRQKDLLWALKCILSHACTRKHAHMLISRPPTARGLTLMSLRNVQMLNRSSVSLSRSHGLAAVLFFCIWSHMVWWKDKHWDCLKVWQTNMEAADRWADSYYLNLLWSSQKWLVCTLSEQEITWE